MTRVPVRPEMLRWACERAGVDLRDLARRIPQLPAWERGEKQPTFKQLESFAKATHTPLGYFFLPEPPEERLPIRDLRALQQRAARPSANLLDTLYAMQRRQRWMSDDRRNTGALPLKFVGTAKVDDDPVAIGQEMRRTVGLDVEQAAALPSWEGVFGKLRRRIENLGALVVINDVVGNDAHRRLDVAEFRGFALVDRYAPLVFVNGADAKSVQMFTLAYELAHLWLGEAGEGLSGFESLFPGDDRIERFCDQAAAEFLVPAQVMKEHWPRLKRAADRFEKLARQLKVSPVIVARRALDLAFIDRGTFLAFYEECVSRERRGGKNASGCDFYGRQNWRVGERFARRVINAALEGRLTFKEAYELTGLHGDDFQKYARYLFDLP